MKHKQQTHLTSPLPHSQVFRRHCAIDPIGPRSCSLPRPWPWLSDCAPSVGIPVFLKSVSFRQVIAAQRLRVCPSVCRNEGASRDQYGIFSATRLAPLSHPHVIVTLVSSCVALSYMAPSLVVSSFPTHSLSPFLSPPFPANLSPRIPYSARQTVLQEEIDKENMHSSPPAHINIHPRYRAKHKY